MLSFNSKCTLGGKKALETAAKDENILLLCHKPNPAKRSNMFYSNYLHLSYFPIHFQDFLKSQ